MIDHRFDASLQQPVAVTDAECEAQARFAYDALHTLLGQIRGYCDSHLAAAADLPLPALRRATLFESLGVGLRLLGEVEKLLYLSRQTCTMQQMDLGRIQDEADQLRRSLMAYRLRLPGRN